jgi:hypothetical protein
MGTRWRRPVRSDAPSWITDPDDGDFAVEHSSPTFADQQAGGPEGIPEPESPKGYAGMEPANRARWYL